jgi:hypothetical protein
MYQTTSNAFTGTTTLTQYVEAGSVTTTYDLSRPPALDAGVLVRIWRDLAVGAVATWLSETGDGTVTASIPHPFLFNTPRTVVGAVANVPREELAIHMNAAWILPAGRKTQITISGGPTYFHVTQGLVIDVTTSSVYPYDTATFLGATVSKTSQWQLGANAGLDVSVRLSTHVGVGGLVRYSRASAQFPMAMGDAVTVEAGGLQLGGGVRFIF